MKKLIGYSNFTSKKGKECTVARVVSDYTESDNKRGSFGQKCDDIFLPDNMVGSLVPKDIGKEVNITYDIVSGRAYVVGFEVVK